jgi:hypothetical protein
VVAHPHGCPSRAFCGCGAAVRIFGKPVRSVWRAANWFRFPRTAPAPGTAAVKRHRVFVLVRHVRGKTWLVYDANSGRHRPRVHPRSIAGWAIVDPRADPSPPPSRCRRMGRLWLAVSAAGCGNPGPTEADMVGCAVRGGGPSLSNREVSDCAVDRAEIRRGRECPAKRPAAWVHSGPILVRGHGGADPVPDDQCAA